MDSAAIAGIGLSYRAYRVLKNDACVEIRFWIRLVTADARARDGSERASTVPSGYGLRPNATAVLGKIGTQRCRAGPRGSHMGRGM